MVSSCRGIKGRRKADPLSPLLANVLLDEVDKELERRVIVSCATLTMRMCMFAARGAGERVMALLRKMYAKLHLTVNEAKKCGCECIWAKVLGFSFWVAPKGRSNVKVTKPMATTNNGSDN